MDSNKIYSIRTYKHELRGEYTVTEDGDNFIFANASTGKIIKKINRRDLIDSIADNEIEFAPADDEYTFVKQFNFLEQFNKITQVDSDKIYHIITLKPIPNFNGAYSDLNGIYRVTKEGDTVIFIGVNRLQRVIIKKRDLKVDDLSFDSPSDKKKFVNQIYIFNISNIFRRGPNGGARYTTSKSKKKPTKIRKTKKNHKRS